MRCRICDVSDVGLSQYRPDHTHSSGFGFHQDKRNPLDFYCHECYTGLEEYQSDIDVLDEEFDDEE